MSLLEASGSGRPVFRWFAWVEGAWAGKREACAFRRRVLLPVGCGFLLSLKWRRRQWGAGPCSPGRSAQPAEPGGERQAVSPLTQTARGVSSLPAASLPLCGDAWVQGRRCCGPGHLPLLSAGALGPRGGQPLWRRGRASCWPEPALETWRTPPPASSADCPLRACGGGGEGAAGSGGARAAAQSGCSCVLCPPAVLASADRGWEPRQATREVPGRAACGPGCGPVGRVKALGVREHLRGQSSSGEAPRPLSAARPAPCRGGFGGRMLAPPALSQGSPHLPQLPRLPSFATQLPRGQLPGVTSFTWGMWPFGSSHRRLTLPARCFEQAQSRAVPGTGRGDQGAPRSSGAILQRSFAWRSPFESHLSEA